MDERAQNDEVLMSLVELALARPVAEREGYLRESCGGDEALFAQAWSYVQWEERMKGFLLDPVYGPEDEILLEPGYLLDGRFRIVREVARGGMGVVFEAWDQKVGRRVAVKCARSGFGDWLTPEVRNASEISHANVCKIFEIHTASTEDGEIDFISMEFLEGDTLAQRLARGPVAEKEVRAISRQVCAGMAEAHRNQVVHGDLKSNNIILTSRADGTLRAVITDFGLARRSDGEAKEGESADAGGAPDYMAPEVRGGANPTTASDVYALGVILFELATGRRPAAQADARELRSGVLARCLNADPARRFRDATEVAAAMEGIASRRWALGLAAAMVAAIAGGAALGYFRGLPGRGIPSVAVIPLANDRETPESEYLSDGISEELINALSQLSGVKVIARSSSFQFRGKESDLKSAARKLGVEALVTGRVAEKDGQLRIAVELVRSRDLAQIWGAQYHRRAAEVAAAQAEISRDVAGQIRARLSETEQAKLKQMAGANPQAWELVLRGRYQMRLYSPGSREKAVSYYEQALGVEPGLAVANAELAYAYRILSGSAVRSAKETMPQAEGAARRALAADPNLAEAHAALADILKDRWNWAEAEKEYRHALALNPNLVTAHQGLAIYLSVMGRHEAAAEQIRRARELDPIGVATAVNAGAVYYNARRFEEAIGELNEATVFDPAAPAPWTWIGIVNGGRGRFDAAITAFEKAMKLGDDTAATLCYYAYALARSGKRDRALTVLARLQGSRAFVPDSALAIVYTGLDQKDRALELLEGSYAAREPLLQYLKAEAHFDALRGQRRFQELASRIGLPR